MAGTTPQKNLNATEETARNFGCRQLASARAAGFRVARDRLRLAEVLTGTAASEAARISRSAASQCCSASPSPCRPYLVCRLLHEKKKVLIQDHPSHAGLR